MSRPDPLILAFDTSAAHCAVALLLGPDIRVKVEPMARGQAERLMPLLEEMLAEADLKWGDLDALGVGIGPGNFTGIRIGVSAARGLALGLEIPAIGVSNFEAAAHGTTGVERVVIPAPQGMAYVQHVYGKRTAPELVRAAEVLGKNTLHADQIPPEERVRNMAVIAAQRRHETHPPPAPLYIKPADAAVSSEPPVVILDDA
ncbi:MAG: tRNA (adenosine(37)-N6)-threonylcarbamoyltransferase complex dimerization subunit type 1 TsaB [Pseudomonadota bacterium]